MKDMRRVANAFAYIGGLIKLSGRRLDRLRVEASPFRKWLTFAPYVAPTGKRGRR